MYIAIAAIVVLVLIALIVMGIFNKLVTLLMRTKNAFSQIEVQLKRRHDLIPNLVETAKGYMQHEKGTLEAVIAARNQAVAGLERAARNPADAQAMHALGSAEGALGGALGRLSVVMEQYPDLKANQQMLALGEELTSTENKVAFSRQAFNDSVTAYNTYKHTIPAVFFAGAFGHGNDAALLEFEDSAEIKQAPKVSFS